MSTHSRLTDDNMRYYQFKARDHYLLQKEDHDWNEFCKQHKCTCCSCQPTSCNKPLKDIGIQVTSKVPFRKPCTNIKTDEIGRSQTSLDEIKKKLENIHITLSEIKQSPVKEKIPFSESVSVNPALSFESRQVENSSALNLLNDQRRAILKTSLVNSLQKLHSFAMQKSLKPPLVSKAKNTGYFLPYDLQKQRLIARKAYLASLTNKPKIQAKKQIPSVNAKRNVTAQGKSKPPEKIPLKPRKKIPGLVAKSKEPETLMQLEAITEAKDENIEKAVDDIVDELLGEELLVISKVKQQRIKRKENNISKHFNNICQKRDVKKVSLCQLSPESHAKVKRIPFFNFKMNETYTKESISSPSESYSKNEQESSTKNNDNCGDIHLNSLKKESGETNSKSVPILSLGQDLTKNVMKQRNLYWHYLEKISRNRTHNFDPVALSNIVAESLLDDCISDVSEELGNVPNTLITDLINLEFTPTV